MHEIAQFIYQVETARMPARIRELQMAAKNENTDNLQMQIRISTLWEEPFRLGDERFPGFAVAARGKDGAMKFWQKFGGVAPLPPGEGGVYSRRVRAWLTGDLGIGGEFSRKISISFVLPRPHPAGRPATLSRRERGTLPCNPCALVIVFLLAATTMAADPAPSATVAATHPSWRMYEVIIQHDIFLRGNGDASGTSDHDRNDSLFNRTGSNAPAAWVLTGVYLQAGVGEAFLENGQTNETVRAHVGELVGGVRIVQIDMDGVELISNGKTLRINVGLQLDGQAPSMTSSSTPQPSSTPGSSANPGTPGSSSTSSNPTNSASSNGTTSSSGSQSSGDSEAAILARLRARHNQEQSK